MHTTRRTRVWRWLAGGALIIFLVAGATSGMVGAAAPISSQAKQALIDATTSELKALAIYQAIVKKLGGDVRPFSRWIESMPGAIDDQLKPLFSKYGVPIPAAPDPGKVQAPASFKDACRVAGQLESERLAFYEKFMKSLKEADVVAAFAEMREWAGRRLNGVQNLCQ
jgi:hypothetical protein